MNNYNNQRLKAIKDRVLYYTLRNPQDHRAVRLLGELNAEMGVEDHIVQLDRYEARMDALEDVEYEDGS